jgi:hypothetical protein
VPQLGAQPTYAGEPLKCNQDTTDWSGKESPGTTKAEKCAWERIRLGQIAVFAKPELEKPDGTRQEESPQSRDSRSLRGEFIKEMLREKWSKQIPVEGIRISGAIIGNLTLDNIAIDQRFECQRCDFEGGARFLYVRPKWFIDLSGSHILGPADPQCKEDERDLSGVLNLGGLSGEGSIILRDVTADCSITLDGARIKENLILQGTDALKLEGKEAQIDGRVSIEHSRFINLSFDKARIGRLVIADINGLYEDEKNGAEISLDGASVDRDLELQGGLIKSVFASNMAVGGKLSIGDLRRKNKTGKSEVRPLTCEGQCVITMHNSNVASLELRDGLPAQFNVVGLTYKSFNLLTENGEDIDPNADDKQRYLKWLYCPSVKSGAPAADSFVRRVRQWFQNGVDCSPEGHSPQPYLQLANVFKVAGLDAEADQVHIWGRDAARLQANWVSWPWETIQWGLIGYGYRKWLAFVWIGFFLVVGWIVVRRSHVARKHHFGFTYSFDMLLPIVRLREAHYKTELELPYRAYFYFHRIIGYLLGLLLLAALSGLTNVS